MLGHEEQVTVRELITRNPDAAGAGASVADVNDWLVENGYTAAPLRRDDPSLQSRPLARESARPPS
jgi:endonuclease YncB( thermonuclease family)